MPTARRFILVSALLLSMAGIGCNQTVYKVLPDLPSPPPTLGGPASTVAPTPQPARPSVATPALGSATGLPAGWVPPMREQQWRYIVIHHSATERGSAASFDKMHREVRGWDELGYHFVIPNGYGGTDGIVEIGPRWQKQKWGAHCGGTPNNEYNEYGIGICLVGNFQAQLPSARQLASLRGLVRFLAGRYGIPPGNILSHRDAPNASTACPGERFHHHLTGQFAWGTGR